MKKLAVFFAVLGSLALSGSGAVSAPAVSSAAPAAPAGLTGMADDHTVQLAWQSVAGASGYTVYRGTTITTVTTRLTTASGTTATTYADSTASNGTTYYYLVRTIAGGVESADSLIVQAKPVAVTCASTNPVVVENCHAGDTTWRTTNPGSVSSGGIEGFADAASVNRGGSVNLRVNSGTAASFRVEVYRSGYYGGSGGRLYSVIRNVPGVPQPACNNDSTTGLVDCSNWTTSATLTTTSFWPSGVYILRIVRTDTGSDNEILLVVRNDAAASDLVYGVGFSTYQSYNNYGGKSLYDFNSIGSPTVSGSARAVKVSFDRPFEQPRSGDNTDWYDKSDYPFVFWMERSGYSVSYIANTDLDTQPSLARNHKAYISPAHDEYTSAGMRSALQQARDAGEGLFFSGANTLFWKVRYEASPYSAKAGRVQVCYKTTAGGPTDPSGIPTGLWRDPNGANQPENALVGQGYTGDADTSVFPMVVSAAEGKDRIWRYTGLAQQQAGTSTSLTGLIAWEWDKRMNNGVEPAGVVTLATSPVTGNIFSSPYVITAGSTNVTAVKYLAPSGALVFSAGTNFWARGLALNVSGSGSVQLEIQQATTNILADMGVQPQTPAPDITLDTSGPPQVIGTSPSNGATAIPPTSTVIATFSRALDPATVTSSTFTLTRPDGSLVPATVSYSGTTASLTPSSRLAWSTVYTANLSAAIMSTDGQALASPQTWSFTTDPGVPPQVTLTVPAAGATGIATSIQPHATFSRALDPTTVTTSSFVLTAANGSTVPATVSYNAPSSTATLAPSARLALGTTYTAQLTTAIAASDGVPLAAPVSWSFTTAATAPVPPTVTGQTPAPGATGVPRTTTVTASFSKDMDPASLASSFTLSVSGGAAVAANVSYDSASKTATLTPVSALSLSTTYTAQVATSALAADGTALASAVSWSFSTPVPLPPPTVTGSSPAGSSTGVSRASTVTATFSRALDPTTITASTFTLTPSGSTTPVAATVSYDGTSFTATLRPTQPLNGSTVYTARVDPAVAGSDGVTMAAPATWSFTTGLCPCQLFSPVAIPASTGNSTQDSRTGTGPFTYELGVKVKVDRAMQVNALRFYKSVGETGTHVGRIWTANGMQLGSVTFTGETASGWQQQALTSAVVLYPKATYVISVNANAKYVLTINGLLTQIDSGGLHSVADGTNGVYALAAATFPTSSYSSSNYFVDVAVTDANLPAPTVTATTPTAGSSTSSIYGYVTATFSRSMDPTTVSASTFTLAASGGAAIPATVSYDDTTLTATLIPNAPLALATSYTATVAGTAQGADLTPLGSPSTWSFTTAATPPPAPTVSGTSPAAGAGVVARNATVTATFSKAMTSSSVNTSTFTLAPAGGPAVAATVAYNATTKTATLTPSAPLAGATQYVSTLTTGLRASDGAPFAANYTWQFTTAACPCSLFSSVLTPASVGNPTNDGRSGAGPFNYELGVKLTVSQPMNLTSIRFYKSPGETGTHVGRIWTAGGLALGSVTFSGDTASGWQQQDLATPIALQVGSVYVVSINANAYYVATQSGLQTQVSSGPMQSVADGQNGVYGGSAGTFPTLSYKSSNYFVDILAVPNGNPTPLTVSAQSPASNATGVAWLTTVTATFSNPVNPSTVSAANFTLTGPAGPVAATVSYNGSNNTATLTPSTQLGFAATYTASLSSSVLGADGQPLTPASWSFQTAPQPAAPFAVSSTSPAAAATGIARDGSVTATFNRSADPSTVTSANFTLKDGTGTTVPATVSYDNPSSTATLAPSALLAPQTTYTAALSTAVHGSDGSALAATSWTFTTGNCPCTLFPANLAPTSTGNPVDDGRTGPGPFSYEMGVKISVTQASVLTAIRFYKSPGETGTHIGRVWTASGTQLAQVAFTNETSSGWQQQLLSQPLALSANTVYVVSVGLNAFYVLTGGGLATQVTSGPLQSVADGLNGVFGTSAGTFPTSSHNSGNYFVDAAVR